MGYATLFMGGIIFGTLIYFLSGLKTTQQQERRIVELFGRYVYTLKPGLGFLLRGIMKIRATVFTWEQGILLFKEPIKIDFKDGSATPKNTTAYVKMMKPDEKYNAGDIKNLTGAYRSIYEIDDWRTATRNLLQNALRSGLNLWTIDEALVKGKAGFNLATDDPEAGLPNDKTKEIKDSLACWGYEITRIIIEDFDLPPEILKARNQIQISEKEAAAAEYERKRKARETVGFLIESIAEATGKSFKEIQDGVEENPTLKDKIWVFSEGLVTREMSAKAKALTDIRTEGGGDIEQVFLRLIAAFNTLRKGEKEKEEKEKEKK